MLEFYKNKTVLVTGNTGFKGSWLCEILLNAGANVIGYSLVPKTKPALFNILGLENRMTTVYGDIRDFPKLKRTISKYQPSIIFHLAAQPIVLDGYKKPKYTYETNVMGTVNLLEAVRVCGKSVKSFLNITTDKVYQNPESPRCNFVESDKLDGFDPYSNSKSCSELVTASYRRSFFGKESEIGISTARAGNVIGGGDFAPNRIIPDCVRAVTKGNQIIVRNPLSTRPYQFVLEPLFAYLIIAERQFGKPLTSNSYNVGPNAGTGVSTKDIVSFFCECWGESARWKTIETNEAPHEAAFLSLDNSLIKKELGWKPLYDAKKAVALTVEWSKGYFEGGPEKAKSITDTQIFDYLKDFEI
jgi:CDP-glucose 4,6-dehydratase